VLAPRPGAIAVAAYTPRVNRHARLASILALVGASAWVGCTQGTPAAPSALEPAESAPSAEAPPLPDASLDARRPIASDAGDGNVVEGPVVGTPECSELCDVTAVACTGELLQFVTKNECMRACAYYPPGIPDEYLGNSRACRKAHVDSAFVIPGHCLHCGAFGIGGCGSTCDGFCQLAMGWCSASAGGAPFASEADCQSACATFQYAPPRPNGFVAFNRNGPATGDSLDCRMYQLLAALESLPKRDVHCPLAAMISAACQGPP
jgi:hypothetical protein